MKKGEMVEGVITNVRYPNKGMMTGKNLSSLSEL